MKKKETALVSEIDGLRRLLCGNRRFDAYMQAHQWSHKFKRWPDIPIERWERSNQQQLAILLDRIREAVATRDVSFFEDFAFFLQEPNRKSKPLHHWLWTLHCDDEDHEPTWKQQRHFTAPEIAARWQTANPAHREVEVSEIGRAMGELGLRLKFARSSKK